MSHMAARWTDGGSDPRPSGRKPYGTTATRSKVVRSRSASRRWWRPGGSKLPPTRAIRGTSKVLGRRLPGAVAEEGREWQPVRVEAPWAVVLHPVGLRRELQRVPQLGQA